jgi:hypothetical protein
MWCDRGEAQGGLSRGDRERMAHRMRQCDADRKFCESLGPNCPMFTKVMCTLVHVLGHPRVSQAMEKRRDEKKELTKMLIGAIDAAVGSSSTWGKLGEEPSEMLKRLMKNVQPMAEPEELARIQCIFVQLNIPSLLGEF